MSESNSLPLKVHGVESGKYVPNAFKVEGGYLGWEIRWTGWVMSSVRPFSVWTFVARHPDKKYRLYSCYPGQAGWYLAERYQIFNLSFQEGQVPPDLFASVEEREYGVQKALEGIKNLSAYPELLSLPEHLK